MPSGFKKKTITKQISLGAQLKAARTKKHLGLSIAEEETKIRLRYLEAMEADDFSVLPASHRKGFLRRYAQYLNIPSQVIEEELSIGATNQPKKQLFSPSMFKKERGWVITPRLLLGIVALGVLFAFFGYVGYQIKRFAQPPTLTITKPAEESVATTDTVTLEGSTEPGSSLLVDNLQVSIKPDGTFSYPLVLRPGLNKISVQSVNTIKKATNKTLSVLYQPNPTLSPSPSPEPTASPPPSPSPSAKPKS